MGLLSAGCAGAGVVVSAVLFAAGCGSSPSTSAPTTAGACTPGLSIACVGPGGCNGFRVCKASGSGYGVCECGPRGSDAGGVRSGPPSDGGDAGVDAKADAAPSAVGPVPVSLSGQTMMESEVELAVAPDGTIAIAWIAITAGPPGSWIAYVFSTDGGATFSPIGFMQLSGGLAGSDPAMSVDAAGNFYLAAIGLHVAGPTPDYTRVFVAKAPKGTTTFGVPVEVTNAQQMLLNDHPKILVTAGGTIVVAFAELPSAMATTATGRAATSRDGQTWHLGTIVAPPAVQFANLFWLCEGAGILYTTYLEVSAINSYVALRSSTDDGATWSATSTVVSLASETAAGLDPGCVASGSDVWVSYATNTSPTTDSTNWLDSAQTIPVAHLGDRGSTVSAARVDALGMAGGSLGLLPVLVREANGVLDVAYLTGTGEGDATGSMRYTRMGTTAFGPSVDVDGPLVFTMNRASMNWLGDYMGAAVSGNRLLLAYPMNTGGTTHIYFRSELLK